jgi:PBSX family phage terminase large subunit
MPVAPKCSECGEPLAGRPLGTKTCSTSCRQKRSRRLAKQRKNIARKGGEYPAHLSELSAVARDVAPDLMRDVIREEARPIAREALTEDVLRSTQELLALTPLAVAEHRLDLASGDERVRQKATEFVLRYTLGNQSIAPTATNNPAPMQVVLNWPTAGAPPAEAPEVAVDGQDRPSSEDYTLPAPGEALPGRAARVHVVPRVQAAGRVRRRERPLPGLPRRGPGRRARALRRGLALVAPLRFDYQPLPTFVPFHLCTEYEAALAGGYGSGKSVALTADAIELGLNQPGSEILVCRRTIPSLRDTTEKIFVNHLPPDFFAACKTSRMGGHYESIQFPNGSVYYFRGLDDWTKLKSMSVAAIYYDEADEIDPDTYEGLLSRVRQRIPTAEARALGAPKITRRKIRLAFNPAGHNWIWQRFIGPAQARLHRWFKSTSLDNPYNPPDYIRSLLAMPTPWVKRYVLCDFDDFGGQIYQNWSYDTTSSSPTAASARPYDYPEGFFLMGMDPGTRDPTAAVWCYYDRDKHCLVAVAQYQQDGLAAPKHAAAWRASRPARHARQAAHRRPARHQRARPRLEHRAVGHLPQARLPLRPRPDRRADAHLRAGHDDRAGPLQGDHRLLRADRR